MIKKIVLIAAAALVLLFVVPEDRLKAVPHALETKARIEQWSIKIKSWAQQKLEEITREIEEKAKEKAKEEINKEIDKL